MIFKIGNLYKFKKHKDYSNTDAYALDIKINEMSNI